MKVHQDGKYPKNYYIKKRRKGKSSFLRVFALFFFLFLLISMGGGLFSYYLLSKDLPDVRELKTYTPSLITKVYSDNDELIKEFFIEKRILVPFDRIPATLKDATLAVEDARFFEHKGLDIYGILRALVSNIRAGGVVEGGSTITQQLAKSMFLTPKKTMERKIKEAILAYRLEKDFSKEEILEIYLNQIYYGHGAYGVEAAARTYFGKHIEELNLPECALIAGLSRAPNNYSPYFNLDRAKSRRAHVLKRMEAEGFISQFHAGEASKSPFELVGLIKEDDKAPYFTEHIRRYLEKIYGSEKIYRGGLQVYTTLNLDYQREAQQALKNGLEVADKRMGYRGPLGHIDMIEGAEVDWDQVYHVVVKEKRETLPGVGDQAKGVVVDISDEKVTVDLKSKKGIIYLKDMSWARHLDPEIDGIHYRIKSPKDALKIGDIIGVKIKSEDEIETVLSLEQEPQVQGALLSIEPQTGAIKVMVGGYDFTKSQFNRVTQAMRQAGSAFKPIIYSAAFEKGFTSADVIIDSPIIFSEEEKETEDWKPSNFEEKFYGPTTLHTAIIHSRNVVTIKLFKKLGIKSVISFARKLGIQSPLNRDLSLALGSSSLTLMELTAAYGVFANKGLKAEPYFIRMIKDSGDNIIEENEPVTEQVISEELAYITTSILQDVVKRGTGWKAKALGRPVAAKTGTTNNYQDAWFMGYTPNLVTGAWVGFDRNRTMGKNETGSRVAVPIWVDYMKRILKNQPIRNFSVPANVVFAKIDPENGLLSSPDNPDAVFQPFLKGTEPKKYSHKRASSEDFFRLDLER
jgi:penicillin-binding protein 1A